MRISDTRQRIVDFIRNFVESKGYAPSMDEIQRALSLSSKSLVEYHLKALKKEGIINRVPEVARAMDIFGVGKRARRIQLLGVIAAGEPIPVPEDSQHIDSEETIDVPADIVSSNIQVYALRVRGKSMIDAFVDDGDIVILNATPAAETGQMVAAWLMDEEKATLKKVYPEPGRIRLQPANPDMAPIYVDPDNLLIQGRVVAVIRKYDLGL